MKIKHAIFTLSLILVFMMAQSQSYKWEALNTGETQATLYDIDFINDSVGYAVGHDGTDNVILKTTDAGESWSNVSSATTTNLLVTCDFLTAKKGIVAGKNSGMYSTIDGGGSWSKIHLGNNLDLLDIQYATSKAIFVSTEGGRVTRFDGMGWLTESVYSKDNFVDVDFLNDTTGYLIAESGRIWRTDNGKDWDSVSNTKAILKSAHFLYAYLGYISGMYGVVKRTINGGRNWTSIKPSGYNNTTFHSVQFVQQNFGFVAGQDGIILRTMDGGSNWAKENGDTTETIYDMSFTPNGTGFVCGTHGMILKRTLTGGTDEIQKEKAIAIYPNPAQNQLFIHADFNKPVALYIYDMQGKLKEVQQLPASNHHVLNVAGYPAGLYILKFKSDGQVYVKKFTRE